MTFQSSNWKQIIIPSKKACTYNFNYSNNCTYPFWNSNTCIIFQPLKMHYSVNIWTERNYLERADWISALILLCSVDRTCCCMESAEDWKLSVSLRSWAMIGSRASTCFSRISFKWVSRCLVAEKTEKSQYCTCTWFFIINQNYKKPITIYTEHYCTGTTLDSFYQNLKNISQKHQLLF